MTAWGKLIATTGSLANTVGANQPFRYGGYVYDEETGFYYLQSRYYDPTTCRFISADVLLSTGQGVIGHNSFAYCLNNPLNRCDPNGMSSFWDKMKKALTVVAAVALVVAIVAVGVALAVPTGGGSLALAGGGVIAASSVVATALSVATSAAQISVMVSATALAIEGGQVMFSKASRESSKTRLTQHPSWVNRSMINPNQTPQQNATRILNNRYGVGKWPKGPGSEYNQIVKWITRCLKIGVGR